MESRADSTDEWGSTTSEERGVAPRLPSEPGDQAHFNESLRAGIRSMGNLVRNRKKPS
jgi:hypothetical protein